MHVRSQVGAVDIDKGQHIIITSRKGQAIRTDSKQFRIMGRSAGGVKGMNISANDEVVGVEVVSDDIDLVVVSEKGYGKRSSLDDYRITNRGGKGVKTINITEKTGNLVAIKNVTDENDIMIINKSGITIRMEVANLRVMGRATQGVRLINIKENDAIASVAKVEHESEPDSNDEDNGTDIE